MKHIAQKHGRLLILAALILILAACSGGDTQPENSTAAPVPTEAAVIDPTAETEPTVETAETVPTAETTSPEEATVQTNTKLNLNQAAGGDYLAAIPDFSDRMVREFLEYRPYISIQQFRREIGKYVDEDTVAYYEQYVYVPIDVDESDAETLQQIPGVDSATAESLLAARPFGSNEAFLTTLAELAPDVDPVLAASFLSQ